MSAGVSPEKFRRVAIKAWVGAAIAMAAIVAQLGVGVTGGAGWLGVASFVLIAASFASLGIGFWLASKKVADGDRGDG